MYIHIYTYIYIYIYNNNIKNDDSDDDNNNLVNHNSVGLGPAEDHQRLAAGLQQERREGGVGALRGRRLGAHPRGHLRAGLQAGEGVRERRHRLRSRQRDPNPSENSLVRKQRCRIIPYTQMLPFLLRKLSSGLGSLLFGSPTAACAFSATPGGYNNNQ